jgi:hypothetical protein
MSGASRFTAEQHAKACAIGFPKWPELYAGPPGSGPAERYCGRCAHANRDNHFTGHCAIGPASSRRISAAAPACLRYQPDAVSAKGAA